MNPDQIPERPAVRKLRLFLESIGEKRGRAEGLAEGKAEGLAEGKAEGAVGSTREALRTVLSERGLSLSKADRERIEKCTDVEQLSAWLRRAVTADSVSEVFAASPKARKPAARARRSRRTTA